jgi:hypothetical protein
MESAELSSHSAAGMWTVLRDSGLRAAHNHVSTAGQFAEHNSDKSNKLTMQPA